MLAINYTTLRTNLKSYFDKAVDNDEDIIITRKNLSVTNFWFSK